MALRFTVPMGAVREARRKERPRLFARFGPGDLPLAPAAARVLEAAGVRGVTLQLFPDGEVVRLVASVALDHRAPAPPLANAPLAPPALGEDGWAAAALSLDAARLVPWACDVAARADEFEGQILRDALVVAKLNLGIDVEKDLAGPFAGTVRALATRGGGDAVALAADVRSPEELEKTLAALSMLSLGSALLGGPDPGLDPARFGGVAGYRLRTPWRGFSPAVVLCGRRLVAGTVPEVMAPVPRALAERLAPAPRDEMPRALDGIGRVDSCAVAVADVLECVRAAREIARAAGLDRSVMPAPASLAWADGKAAVAVRVGGEGLQAWGAWAPARSALGVPADDTVAQSFRDQ